MPEPKCGDCRDLIAYLSTLTGVEPGKPGRLIESEGGLTFAQIAKPKPADWTNYHGQIGGNRHSALTQITPANAKDSR